MSDDKDMASILNLTFNNVFTEENNAIISTPLNISHKPDEEMLHITEFDDVKQRDIGVIISDNLSLSNQDTAASKKANKLLGIISRNFNHKSQIVMKRLNSICEATLRICD